MRRWIFVLPILVFGGIAFFLFRSLYLTPSNQALPSPLIGKPVPLTVLPALDAETAGFGPKDFTQGKVIVVNVFSSTCAPCREEAPMLDQLAKMPGMTLYGFVWKDKAASARDFLNELGNPFSRIGFDGDGREGLEWGIYGWPETFVIDGHGIVRFKYDAGPLTPDVINQQLLPAIEAARRAS